MAVAVSSRHWPSIARPPGRCAGWRGDRRAAALILPTVIHTRVIAVAVSAGQTAKPPLFVRFANKAAGYAVAIGPLRAELPALNRTPQDTPRHK